MPGGKIRKDLERELKLMKSDNWVISSNLILRRDGLPYAGQKTPADPGIALYFTRKGKEICISCDRYMSMDANLRAIGKTIEAIRGIERWGTEEMMDAAFTGFAALPETTSPSNTKVWWEILDLTGPDVPDYLIDAAYKHLIKRYHPDNQTTGNDVLFHRVQEAYKEATGSRK
jgi:hypothetical protein